MKNGSAHRLWEGTLAGGLSYVAEGSGSPLVLFRGVTPSPHNATGVERWAERRFIAPLTRHFTVYTIGRRPGYAPGISLAEMAADYARAIEEEFQGKEVSLFGMSTSGSLALQFAADYPGLVHKLALVATAYRLGPIGRDVQRRYADLLEHGNYRQAFQALAPGLAASPAGQRFLGGLMWLSAPSKIEDPKGMVTLLRAEDAFDLGNRLNEISAPTLLIGGDHDRLYPPELVKQTAERLPHARLILYQKHGHRETIADRRLFQDVLPFLIDEFTC